MAKVLNCVRSFSRSVTKVHSSRCVVNRLCLRNSALIRIFSSRARTCSTSRHSSSTAALPVFSNELEYPENAESNDILSCDPVKLTGLKSTWMDREALHHVLEDSPLLQNNVFTLRDLKNTNISHNKYPLLAPSAASMSEASPAEIIDFVKSYSCSMGRQDFQEICKHVEGNRTYFYIEKYIINFFTILYYSFIFSLFVGLLQ